MAVPSSYQPKTVKYPEPENIFSLPVKSVSRRLIESMIRDGDERAAFHIWLRWRGHTLVVMGSALAALEGHDDEIGEERIIRLMETVDSWLDVPPRTMTNLSTCPLMVFSIAGRVERGTIMKSRSSDMVPPPRPLSWALTCSTRSSIRVKPVTSEVSSLNRFKGVKRSLHLGTVNSVKKFVAAIYAMTKEEGGRSYAFSSGYKPRLYSRTTNVTCGVTWPGGTADAETKMIMPGDNVEMVLVEPRCSSGSRFPIHTEREWTDGQ
ncbi:translation elongation factor Tu [Tulasnella sp. 419]|nr:translation elongation factor Tu [Tulasnella sp. 419]